MTSFGKKLIQAINLRNIRRVLRYLFRDPRGLKGRNIRAVLRFILIDLKNLKDEELKLILEYESEGHKFFHRLGDEARREYMFRMRRKEFEGLSDKGIEFKLDALRLKDVCETLEHPPTDDVDKAFTTELHLKSRIPSHEEYVLARILEERQNRRG